MRGPLEDKSPPAVSEPPRRRRGLRIALICVGALIVLVLAFAGGSYWWFSSKVHGANSRIDPATEQALNTAPPSTLVSVPQSPGSGGTGDTTAPVKTDPPMDIIVLGSDPQPGVVNTRGSSDVIMLIHVDTANDYLSVLSITRDLYVSIPGYGQNRINAAYTFGGPPLTITTIKQVFGVNATKYLQIGFQAFQDIIDSVGGVYVDVDRNYPAIDYGGDGVPAGYRLLDGAHALTFSRYRHDEYSDFGRMERQQRVLDALRDQLRGWNLSLKLPGIVSNILDVAATNLSANELIGLGTWMARLDGGRIRKVMVRGSGEMIDGKAVVVADQEALKTAVTDLLTPPPAGTASATTSAGLRSGDVMLASTGAPSFARVALQKAAVSLPDETKWRALQRKVPFALEEPAVLPAGFTFSAMAPVNGGTYEIKPGDAGTQAVRVIYRHGDDYLGITATTWTDAPAASPGEQVIVDGTTYTLTGTSGKLDRIWWVKGNVLYFISNTVMNTVSSDDLVALAESMQPVK
jgi:polyisoprenyl-teichoic acid--peptidoglycan teichoic acid transferase